MKSEFLVRKMEFRIVETGLRVVKLEISQFGKILNLIGSRKSEFGVMKVEFWVLKSKLEF